MPRRKQRKYDKASIHYSLNAPLDRFETIDVIQAGLSPDEFRGFLKGNILKYTLRSRLSAFPERDLEKAKFYLTWLTEFSEQEA